MKNTIKATATILGGSALAAALSQASLYKAAVFSVVSISTTTIPAILVGSAASYISYKLLEDTFNSQAVKEKKEVKNNVWSKLFKKTLSLLGLLTLEATDKVKAEVKSVVKTKVKKNPKKKPKKITYQPLSNNEMKAFRNRLNKIKAANTNMLDGDKKRVIEDFKYTVAMTDLSLDDCTVEELKAKGGIIRAVRMINEMKNTQDVVNFSKNDRKIDEIVKLIEAVENRKDRKIKLAKLEAQSKAIDEVIKSARENNVTVKTEMTKRKITTENKARNRPSLKRK